MKQPIPFGKYYLLERINVGGMAEVFRAKAYGVEGFERLLAVKRILPNIAEDEEFIEMFIDEAKIAVQLNHANIAQIFDLGKVDDSYFIALEYIHGKDLRAIFDRCRSLSETMPIPQACFIIMKVCEGLDYAHNKRDASGREMHLVHRDVSPQNVLISYEGEVKLVDFGIAKAAGKASKTQAGILKGKFGYMSPEQVRGLPLDRRSDIFSVGIVLYELLTGERLFLGESDFSTLEKVRNVEILPPSTYNRKIGEELEQIVLKALAKDVEDRYQNAIDLHDDLQAYMYTAGEFYSRKDLAAWSKQTFAREIEEENKKLEAYRQLPAPQLSPAPPPVPTASQPGFVPPPPAVPMGGNGHSGADRSLPRAAATVDFPSDRPGGLRGLSPDTMGAAPALTWDEEEVETQIYDKPSSSSPGPLLDGTFELSVPPSGAPAAHAAAGAAAGVSAPMVVVPTAPGEERGAPRRKVSTAQVQALPYAPATVERRASGRLVLWLSVAGLVGLCGAALFYFLIYAKQPGAIAVASVPTGAEVLVDGKLRSSSGGTPATVGQLEPGYYNVMVRKRGYEPWEQTVKVSPNATLALQPRLDPLATAVIELRTGPAGGNVSLDGRRLDGRTPMKITQVAPGHHRLEVDGLAGYHPLVHEFDVEPEQTKKLFFKLLPLQVSVKIASEPSGEVFVVRDGQRERLGRSPLDIKLNPKFSYQVVVRRDDYREWKQPVEFDGDTPVTILAKLERQPHTPAPPRQANEPPEPKPLVPKPPPKVTKPAPHRPRSPRRASPPVRIGAKPATRATPPGPVDPPERPAPPPPREPPKPAGVGTLMVNSKPWTRIIVDGKDTGLTTPQLRIPLAAGKHRVTLRNPKFQIDQSFTVFIRPSQSMKLIKNFLGDR